MRLRSHSEAETLAIGRAIGALLRPGDIVAIDGPLGAGKTRLVRGVAMGMGLDGSVVSSPTFVVINEYERGGGGEVAGEPGTDGDTPDMLPRRLFHVDAYRISGPEDLESLGWERIIDPSSDAAVAIEWAERITGLASFAGAAAGAEQRICRVRMDPEGETDRRVTIDAPGAWGRDAGRGPAWQDLMLVSSVLAESGAATGNVLRAGAPLPRGWGRCPTTGKPVPPDAPTFPFADERARLADLGRWMSGSYTISREITSEDDEG